MRALLVLMLVLVVGGAIDAQIFRTAIEETALTGPTASEYAPTLTADQLTVYFTSTRAGGLGARDIWMSTRPAIGQPWSTPVNVAAVNSTGNEYYVTVRPDDLEIIVSSDRTGGSGGTDLWSFTRAKTTDPWGTGVNLTTINTTNYEDDPSIRGDGLELFFSSSRSGQSQLTGIWKSTRPDLKSAWTAAVLVKELDTANDDHSPAISGDGLTLFFSIYNYPGGTGSSDYFMATRPDLNSPFGTFTEIKEVNTTGWDHNGTQTIDGFSFYYTPNSVNKIYRADRILPVVYPPLGDPVIGQPFVIYVRRDPGDAVGVIVGSLLLLPSPVKIAGIQGQLEINMGAAFFMAVGMLDKEGRYTTKLPVPNAPVLKGLPVYFEGAAQDTKNVVFLSAAKKVTIG